MAAFQVITEVHYFAPSPIDLTPEQLASVKWNDGGAIPPQGNRSFKIETPRDVMQRHIEDIRANRVYVYNLGEIVYQDTNGRRHKTQYCFFLRDPATKTLASCDRWNDMN
jgi:hypothetical protein